MVPHGTVAAFYSLQETWTAYFEHLEQYFAANKIKDAGHTPRHLWNSYLLAHLQFCVTQEAKRLQISSI